jgi:hypothetical protein
VVVDAEQARTWLSRHGKLASQPPEDWTGDFPLPSSVAAYFWDVGPVNVTIDLGGNPAFLPKLSLLWKRQEGYRYTGRKRQPIPGWPDDWLVVGDIGADPLILVRRSGGVWFAEHGEEEWEAEPLFPDLNSMAACLAVLGSYVKKGEVGPVRADLASLLGSTADAARVLDALGFGDA